MFINYKRTIKLIIFDFEFHNFFKLIKLQCLCIYGKSVSRPPNDRFNNVPRNLGHLFVKI